MALDAELVRSVVASALREDLAEAGDVTTRAVFPDTVEATATILARSALVLAGVPLALEVFRSLGHDLQVAEHARDGTKLEPGEPVLTIRGDARPMLEGERTALNFLMRMSGVATSARRAVDEVAGTGARILDTRKTLPGWRMLDKYAVACGGAVNHRMGLYDAVMIKDTHLAVGVGIREAVGRALEQGHPRESVTVEVDTLDQLRDAVASGAGRVLLDNMDVPTLRKAVELAGGRVVLEASGGLRPGALRAAAETGVDFLSLGWITHSAPAADLAMETELSS